MSYNPNSTGTKLTLSGSTSGEVIQNASASGTTYNIFWPPAQGTVSTTLINDGAGNLTWGAGGGGSGVSSVALSLPVSLFSVSGSPVTTTGTLTGSLVTQGANSVFAGPVSGSAAAPTFRSLVATDIPNLTSYLSSTLMTTAGDIIFENASPAPARLTIGSTGQVLTVSGGLPAWATPASGASINKFTLSLTDITNKFVTLTSAPNIVTNTILTVIGGPMQSYGDDYTVSGSQLSWSGLFLDGVLISGDMLVVQYN